MKLFVVTATTAIDALLMDTLKSVAAQQLEEGFSLEHLVWVGGRAPMDPSTIQADYPHVRFVARADSGLYDALGQAFAAADADVISYLNSGDLWTPWTARTVLRVLQEETNISWLCGRNLYFDELGKRSVSR